MGACQNLSKYSESYRTAIQEQDSSKQIQLVLNENINENDEDYIAKKWPQNRYDYQNNIMKRRNKFMQDMQDDNFLISDISDHQFNFNRCNTISLENFRQSSENPMDLMIIQRSQQLSKVLSTKQTGQFSSVGILKNSLNSQRSGSGSKKVTFKKGTIFPTKFNTKQIFKRESLL